MKRPKLAIYLALLTGLVLSFLFQGCSFYARLGSVEQSSRLTGKIAGNTMPEKAAVTGAEQGGSQYF